ncbi:hypothetical protein HK100_009872 [Physocladia obscura]|uniref:Uncharacterized protein n=1 Tax=Physocladia obscura TaxID=109957 RepID=A0AAD5T8Z8_9FUNG|nr:hypothetical protein HK100_009872 [Physocladia obscura]
MYIPPHRREKVATRSTSGSGSETPIDCSNNNSDNSNDSNDSPKDAKGGAGGNPRSKRGSFGVNNTNGTAKVADNTGGAAGEEQKQAQTSLITTNTNVATTGTTNPNPNSNSSAVSPSHAAQMTRVYPAKSTTPRRSRRQLPKSESQDHHNSLDCLAESLNSLSLSSPITPNTTPDPAPAIPTTATTTASSPIIHRRSSFPLNSSSSPSPSISRRPIKTDAVARRLIGGALGIKMPSKSEEALELDRQKKLEVLQERVKNSSKDLNSC